MIDMMGSIDQGLAGVSDPRTADVYSVLDELSDMVEVARAMPMSDKCVVNRNEVLDLLDALRQMLPTAVQEAEELLADRVGVVEEGYREAERLISDARVTAAHLTADHEITQAALSHAEEIRGAAQAEVDQMRVEVDQYVDEKLASFEATLSKTLTAVQRGRDRIRDRSDGGALPPYPG